MRKSLIYLALLLVGCGGSGGADVTGPVTQRPPVSIPPILHIPEITNLAVSPQNVMYMDGDGNVVVTAEIAFADTGLDIQTLWVRMPDGTSIEFDKSIDTETGTITENFTVSTARIGEFALEFWLEDAAGDSSIPRTAEFNVAWDAQSSDWTSRLSGLPYNLNDVIWDGAVFIAVGGGGTVLTSADGIDWVARASGTDANLSAVAAHGRDIFAVSYEIVLQSTDHGETWVVKDGPAHFGASAVVVNTSHVVIAGNVPDLFGSLIAISADRGETWQDATISCGFFCGFFSDLYYRDGLFVATTSNVFSEGGQALVSTDGVSWTSVIDDERAGLLEIIHDGSQYIVSGANGMIITSFDGLNWTHSALPVANVDYASASWNGSKLVLAGGYAWRYYNRGDTPQFEVPVGVSSTDGGVTWDIFNIDGEYESHGMAFGNGLFVSVGQSTTESDEGAIYTSD